VVRFPLFDVGMADSTISALKRKQSARNQIRVNKKSKKPEKCGKFDETLIWQYSLDPRQNAKPE
jgi:hypothetical protein